MISESWLRIQNNMTENAGAEISRLRRLSVMRWLTANLVVFRFCLCWFAIEGIYARYRAHVVCERRRCGIYVYGAVHVILAVLVWGAWLPICSPRKLSHRLCCGQCLVSAILFGSSCSH